MPNELIQLLTGLGVVTTPAVGVWLLVAGLNVALKNGDKIEQWEQSKPRLAAFVGVLQGAGFDPRKTATKTRDFLQALLKSRFGSRGN